MADLRLTYSLSGPESESLVKHFSVRHFFVRVEDGVDSSSYLLYQAGKFFPLYSVDSSDETYTRLTPPVTASLGPLSRHQKPSAEDGEKKAEASAGAEVTAGDGEKPAVTRTAAEEPALRSTKKNTKVAGIDCLLQETPALALSLTRRDPYLDPLNHIQVKLLGRVRDPELPETEQERWLEPLLRSINAIASGMRNTG